MFVPRRSISASSPAWDERLVEALLTLATSERGLDRRELIDLASVTRRALALHDARAECAGLQLAVQFGHAVIRGDPDLTERMAANLIDNAIRYNVRGGSLEVRTETQYDHAVLTVINTGLPIPADQAGRLCQPFARLAADRARHPDGHGLGLSIVRAIAAAHDADLVTKLRLGGGLAVEVRFPAAGALL
jgi:signal transduction histidine kinase